MRLLKGLRTIYTRLLPEVMIVELRRELSECTSILDVGCGENSCLKYATKKRVHTVGLDIFLPYILHSKSQKLHGDYVLADARFLGLKEDSFDCVIALDLIEHLTKKEGHNLLKSLEKIAKKKIIIFTPNGFLPQSSYDSNIYQAHKSEWNVTELRQLGYKIKGINGLYLLRGERAVIRYKPERVFKHISDATQKLTYHLPSLAFQLFCVKDV